MDPVKQTIQVNTGVAEFTIEAPEGKTMVIDQGLLAHGILSIGEYGASGTKIAVYKNWESAILFPDDSGYKITEGSPF